jgi:hypothetical protein
MENEQCPEQIHEPYRDSIVMKESQKPSSEGFFVVNGSETGSGSR